MFPVVSPVVGVGCIVVSEARLRACCSVWLVSWDVNSAMVPCAQTYTTVIRSTLTNSISVAEMTGDTPFCSICFKIITKFL